jgi:hypothetical protein
MCKEYGNIETDLERMLNYIADTFLLRNLSLSNDRNIYEYRLQTVL